MEEGVRPEYHRIMVKCTSCRAEFETDSTDKKLRVDTCSNCHPFYTGHQRFVAAQGRIKKFNEKYGLRQRLQWKGGICLFSFIVLQDYIF